MAYDSFGNLFGIVIGTGLLLWTLDMTQRMYSHPETGVGSTNVRGLNSIF
jgi:hypothetical protein